MKRLPSKLEHPPLLEAVFEIRFNSTQEGGGELLPGLLFSLFRTQFKSAEPTPAGIIPKIMRQQHPLLKYAAQYRLQGTSEALLLGDNVLSLSLTPPYPGWSRFRARCVEVANALQSTGLAASVERYSLKYVNHLPTRSLEAFTFRIDLAGYRMAANGFLLRFETQEGPFLSIVECTSAHTLENETVKKSGMGFSIDTICQSDLEGFWTDVEHRVESAHRVLEGLFFGLLSPTTLQDLGPSWD
jgi:uncharacterized protein (TIGR04255 family)